MQQQNQLPGQRALGPWAQPHTWGRVDNLRAAVADDVEVLCDGHGANQHAAMPLDD